MADDLASHKLLVTPVRTGDIEVFIVGPVTSDLVNVALVMFKRETAT